MTVSFENGKTYMSRIAAAANVRVSENDIILAQRNFVIYENSLEPLTVYAFLDGSNDDDVFGADVGSDEVLLLDFGPAGARLCVYKGARKFITAPAPDDPADGLAWVRMAYRCGLES